VSQDRQRSDGANEIPAGLEPDSDEDNDPVKIAANKRTLLEWVVDVDMTKEISLLTLANHPFKLDSDEESMMMSIGGLMKVMKVIMYKVGLNGKRMDIFRSEFLTALKNTNSE